MRFLKLLLNTSINYCTVKLVLVMFGEEMQGESRKTTEAVKWVRWSDSHVHQWFSTNLLKVLKHDVHQTSGSKDLEQLCTEVARNGFHKAQCSHNRVLGAADFLQMGKYSHEGATYSLELRGRQKIIERKILHQWIVVVDRCQRLFQTYKSETWQNQSSQLLLCILPLVFSFLGHKAKCTTRVAKYNWHHKWCTTL